MPHAFSNGDAERGVEVVGILAYGLLISAYLEEGPA